MKTSPFSKPKNRDYPKTVRLTQHQHDILARLVQIKGDSATATDVMLEALDEYTQRVLRRTKDRRLKQLVTP
jgi:hypothetical protein